MNDDIENIPFLRFAKQDIPFELISIRELYQRVSEQNFDLSKPHRIDFHALIIVFGGKSKHTIDFKEEAISTGTILPIKRGQIHSFNKQETVKGYVIGFEDAFITQNINDKNLFHFLQIFYTPNIQIGKKSINSIESILLLIERLVEDGDTNLKAEIICSSFMTLLFQIKRLACKQHIFFETERLKNFYLFKESIIKNYNKLHSAKDYAKKLNVSYNYLNNICKEITNKTAKEFIDGWLLLEIKRNISENKYTSQEIAFKMGFKEPSNFNRFFKKHTKITPLQFLENLKKNNSI